MALRITGCITALATPFTVEGQLDLPAWHELIERQLAGGVESIVVAGSTGEAASLTDEEYDTLLRLAVDQVAGRIPVIAGTGLSNTAKTIALTQRAAQLGADAALVVTPPYVRPTVNGLIAHYREDANQGGLPVILYNVPGRTGTDMDIRVVEALYQEPHIVGIKEARNDAARMTALLAFRTDSFTILSGDDPTASRAMLEGADGLVSVGSNAAPRAFRRLCDLSRSGETEQAAVLNTRMETLYDFFGIESNPIPVKAALQLQGIGYGLRLPLQELSADNRPALESAHALIGQIEADCT